MIFSSTLAFAQLARRNEINMLAKKIQDWTHDSMEAKYGKEPSNARTENIFVCVGEFHGSRGEDILAFFTGSACSEKDLRGRWQRKALKICKQFRVSDAGVKNIIIYSGLNPHCQGLVVELATLKTELTTKNR